MRIEQNGLQTELVNLLEGFLTAERKAILKQVLEQRTDYLTVVLEDIYQNHNASAVLRSCDCFGIQQVHVIENKYQYELNPKVVRGASKWIDMHRYNQQENNTLQAIQKLKADGYRIVATSLAQNSVSLDELDLQLGKTALVFGTEMKGISNVVSEHADAFMRIPMYGFTQSFNISVSVGISLHYLANKLRSSGINWQLTEQERKRVYLDWLKTAVKKSDLIIDEYLQTKTADRK